MRRRSPKLYCVDCTTLDDLACLPYAALVTLKGGADVQFILHSSYLRPRQWTYSSPGSTISDFTGLIHVIKSAPFNPIYPSAGPPLCFLSLLLGSYICRFISVTRRRKECRCQSQTEGWKP